jgi:site-specific DNA recombinase
MESRQRTASLIRAPHDDPGYSRGSTSCPAVQRLLADILERKIDVVVVYKSIH